MPDEVYYFIYIAAAVLFVFALLRFASGKQADALNYMIGITMALAVVFLASNLTIRSIFDPIFRTSNPNSNAMTASSGGQPNTGTNTSYIAPQAATNNANYQQPLPTSVYGLPYPSVTGVNANRAASLSVNLSMTPESYFTTAPIATSAPIPVVKPPAVPVPAVPVPAPAFSVPVASASSGYVQAQVISQSPVVDLVSLRHTSATDFVQSFYHIINQTRSTSNNLSSSPYRIPFSLLSSHFSCCRKSYFYNSRPADDAYIAFEDFSNYFSATERIIVQPPVLQYANSNVAIVYEHITISYKDYLNYPTTSYNVCHKLVQNQDGWLFDDAELLLTGTRCRGLQAW